VTDSDGTRPVYPGEILDDGEDIITGLPGRVPENKDGLWQDGRPLSVLTEEKRIIVSRLRMNKKSNDMDYAIPRDILSKRQKLAADRLKQERER